MKKEILKISSLSGLILICLFLFTFVFAQQTEPPATEGTAFMASISLPVRVVKIEITSEPGAQEIRGKFTVWNEGDSYVSGIGYVMNLIPGADLSKEFPLKSEIKNDVFNLDPDATAWQNFSFTIPSGLNSGTYTFQIATIDSRGSFLGWQTEVMELVGENRFLTIKFESVRVLYPIPSEEQLRFVVDNIGLPETTKVGDIVEVPARFGPTFFEFPPLPKVKFVVTNPTRTEILAVPHLVIREDTDNGKILQEFDKESLTFQPNEIKTVILEMPEILIPKSYHASVYFLSDNQFASNSVNFIWVVGGASAKIFNIQASQDLFKKGETANIVLNITGAADGATVIKDSSFRVKIKDSQGALCGQKEFTGTLIPQIVTLSISVPIEKDCFNPQITAEIQKDNQILDSKTLNIQTTSVAPPEVKPFSLAQKIAFSILIIIIIILVIMIIYFLIKKRKPSLKVPLLFIFSSILFFSLASQVQAAKVCGIEAGPITRTIDGIIFTCVGGLTNYYWQTERAITQTEAQNTALDFQAIYGNNKTVRLYNPQGKYHTTPTTYASYWVINSTPSNPSNNTITLQSYQYRFPKDASTVIDGITYTAKVEGTSQYLFPSRAISQTETQNTADDLKQIFGNNVNVRLYNPQGKYYSNPTTYASYWIINTTADNQLIGLKNPLYRFPLASTVTFDSVNYTVQYYGRSTFVAQIPIDDDSIVRGAINDLEEIYGHNISLFIYDYPYRNTPNSHCKVGQIFMWIILTDSNNLSGGKITSDSCYNNTLYFAWNSPINWNITNPSRIPYIPGWQYDSFAEGWVAIAGCDNAYGEIWVNAWLEDIRTPDPDDWIPIGVSTTKKGIRDTREAMLYMGGIQTYSGVWTIPPSNYTYFKVPSDMPYGFAKVKVDAYSIFTRDNVQFRSFYEDTRTICIGSWYAGPGPTHYIFNCIDSFPDLTVESPSYSPLSPNAGSPMTFTGTVKNIGTYNAGSSQTNLLIDDTDDGTDNGTEQAITSTDGLAINGRETETFTWTPLNEGAYTFQICADARGEIEETNENNNCSTPIPFTVSGVSPTNRPPTAINLNAEPKDCCFHDDVGGRFTWEYYDPDNKPQGTEDPQDGYWMQIIPDGGNFSSPLLDTCPGGENSGTCLPGPGHSSTEFTPVGRPFGWNVDYHWRVKVKDSRGMWSPWAYPPNTGTLVTGPNLPTTPSDGSLLNTGDPWPWPEFNYQPQDGVEQTCSNTNCNIVLVAPGKSLTLWNESQTRHAEYCPNGCTYLWDFGDGQIYDGLTPPAHNYSEGIYVLTLTATDSTNLDHYCKLKLNVSVGGAKLPKWIEIPPLSARQNFLASFSQSFGF